jgi:DNA primase
MVYPDRPYWIKVHGHSGVRFLDLVNGGRKPVGSEFVEAVRRLCELAGVPFPARTLTPEQEEAARVRETRRSSLDSAVAFFQERLWSADGGAGRDYLTGKRGFTEAEIRSLGLGLCTSVGELQDGCDKKGRIFKSHVKPGCSGRRSRAGSGRSAGVNAKGFGWAVAR